MLYYTVIVQYITTKVSITKTPFDSCNRQRSFYPLSICKFIILRKSKELCHAGFAMSVRRSLAVLNSVISSFAQSPVMFPPTITGSLLWVRPRLQNILTTLTEALVPFDPLHSFRGDIYSIEDIRHERSSLICFLTAKISVLVNSLLLLFGVKMIY